MLSYKYYYYKLGVRTRQVLATPEACSKGSHYMELANIVAFRNHGVMNSVTVRNKQLRALSAFTSHKALQGGRPLSRKLAFHAFRLTKLPLPWKLVQLRAVEVSSSVGKRSHIYEGQQAEFGPSEHRLSPVKAIAFRTKGATQVDF